MAQAYSLDLRQKIVDAYERGGISQDKLAQQFGVARSFVQKLLKQKAETSSIAPKVRTEQTPAKLQPDHQEVIRQLLVEKNDRTLAELCDGVAKHTGMRVGISTMHRTLNRMGYSFKKKRFTQTKRQQHGCNKPE